MSKINLYIIYDHVALQTRGVMIPSNRDEHVIRQFSEVLAQPDTDLGKYPNDFSLLHVGEQEQDTGVLTPCEPRTVFTGRIWKRLQELGSAGAPPETPG